MLTDQFPISKWANSNGYPDLDNLISLSGLYYKENYNPEYR